MNDLIKIPMFPLSVFPLPGELLPLHIFEPRYRQLLEDAETKDIAFGIYFSHVSNLEKVGSLVKLESVIKRYKSGESDIIVKCIDLLSLSKLYRTYRDKLYPGGEVELWHVDMNAPMTEKLRKYFTEYQELRRINHADKSISLYDAANQLNLGFEERIKLVRLEQEHQDAYLVSHLKFQTRILKEAEKAKDVYHLN